MYKYKRPSKPDMLTLLVWCVGYALVGYLVANASVQSDACKYEWKDTGFRVPVERVPDDEANAYYDGRKLVNDNQRNYVDQLAEENK